MRTLSSVSLKSLYGIVLLSLLSAFSINAQNIWRGGTPGQESDWNNPRNWSENHVPDWSDAAVVIPNVENESGYFPVITEETPRIPYLLIEGGAYVTILESGHLIIDGGATHNYGIYNVGSIYNGGQLTIMETALEHFARPHNNIHNYGSIALGNIDGQFEELLAIDQSVPTAAPYEQK